MPRVKPAHDRRASKVSADGVKPGHEVEVPPDRPWPRASPFARGPRAGRRLPKSVQNFQERIRPAVVDKSGGRHRAEPDRAHAEGISPAGASVPTARTGGDASIRANRVGRAGARIESKGDAGFPPAPARPSTAGAMRVLPLRVRPCCPGCRGEARKLLGEFIAVRQVQPALLHREEIVPCGGVGAGVGATPAFLGVPIAFADFAAELLEHDASPAPSLILIQSPIRRTACAHASVRI